MEILPKLLPRVPAMFFQCGLGHMMGLDVRDMENLGEEFVGYGGKPKALSSDASRYVSDASLRRIRPHY